MARVSIRDVAIHAGVSVGTVSNVLNRPNLVAEATRIRVQAAIGELGFVRNESARQLRQGRGRTFGLLLETMADPYISELGRGVQAAMNADGFDTLWCSGDGSATGEQRCFDFLEEQNVSGVIVVPVRLDRQRIAELRTRGLAVVLLDRAADDVCSALADHRAGGELAACHVLGRGRRRIAYVTGPLRPGPLQDRLDGVRAAARAADAPAPVVVEAPAPTPIGGQEAARRVLELDPPPAAVLCANDRLAVGLLNELLRAGVKVPSEISVVGYDDLEIAATAVVPLTTVRRPRHELGRLAAELAVAEASDAEGHEHRRIVLTPELVVRESA